MSLPLLYFAVFAGGVLTILSPCILPVLPFVFARGPGDSAGGRGARRFARDTLPLLAGLILAYTAAATAGTLGAAWVARAAEWGRWAALALVTLAGAALLSPRLAGWAARPAERLGAHLTRGAAPGSSAGRPWGAGSC